MAAILSCSGGDEFKFNGGINNHYGVTRCDQNKHGVFSLLEDKPSSKKKSKFVDLSNPLWHSIGLFSVYNTICMLCNMFHMTPSSIWGHDLMALISSLTLLSWLNGHWSPMHLTLLLSLLWHGKALLAVDYGGRETGHTKGYLPLWYQSATLAEDLCIGRKNIWFMQPNYFLH